MWSSSLHRLLYIIIFAAIECEELEPIDNGVITYEPDTTALFSLDTNANHMCNPGFRLVGASVRVCTDVGENQGEFDQEPPTCIRKYDQLAYVSMSKQMKAGTTSREF